jgi:hypothetical protein
MSCCVAVCCRLKFGQKNDHRCMVKNETYLGWQHVGDVAADLLEGLHRRRVERFFALDEKFVEFLVLVGLGWEDVGLGQDFATVSGCISEVADFCAGQLGDGLDLHGSSLRRAPLNHRHTVHSNDRDVTLSLVGDYLAVWAGESLFNPRCGVCRSGWVLPHYGPIHIGAKLLTGHNIAQGSRRSLNIWAMFSWQLARFYPVGDKTLLFSEHIAKGCLAANDGDGSKQSFFVCRCWCVHTSLFVIHYK